MATSSLESRVALVTGGARGIGRAMVLCLAREGASVAVVDVIDDEGVETVGLVEAAGGTAAFVHADVSRPADAERMVGEVVGKFGGLHVALNNAGVMPAGVALADVPVESWNRVISINLTGVFLAMKYELQHMLAHGGGAIVNTSSSAGRAGYPGVAEYSAAKFGVVGLTKTAALDYATAGIRVNAIAPGPIRTPMMAAYIEQHPEHEQAMASEIPMNRLGTPEEVAELAVWLASDAASFVNGELVAVDGAQVAR